MTRSAYSPFVGSSGVWFRTIIRMARHLLHWAHYTNAQNWRQRAGGRRKPPFRAGQGWRNVGDGAAGGGGRPEGRARDGEMWVTPRRERGAALKGGPGMAKCG